MCRKKNLTAIFVRSLFLVFFIYLCMTSEAFAISSVYRDLAGNGTLMPSVDTEDAFNFCFYRQDFNDSGGELNDPHFILNQYNSPFNLPVNAALSLPIDDITRQWSPPVAGENPNSQIMKYIVGAMSPFWDCPITPADYNPPQEAWAVLPPYGFTCDPPSGGTVTCHYNLAHNYAGVDVVAIAFSQVIPRFQTVPATQGTHSFSFDLGDLPLGEEYQLGISAYLGNPPFDLPIESDGTRIGYTQLGFPPSGTASSGLILATDTFINLLPPIDPVTSPAVAVEFENVDPALPDGAEGQIRQANVRLSWTNAATLYNTIDIFDGLTVVAPDISGTLEEYLFSNAIFNAAPTGTYGIQPKNAESNIATMVEINKPAILPEAPISMDCTPLVPQQLAFSCTLNTHNYSGDNTIGEYHFQVTGPLGASQTTVDVLSTENFTTISVDAAGDYQIGGYYIAGINNVSSPPLAIPAEINNLQPAPTPVPSPVCGGTTVSAPEIDKVKLDKHATPNDAYNLKTKIEADSVNAAIHTVEVFDEDNLVVATFIGAFAQELDHLGYTRLGKRCFKARGLDSNGCAITPDSGCKFFQLNPREPKSQASLQEHTVSIRYSPNLPGGDFNSQYTVKLHLKTRVHEGQWVEQIIDGPFGATYDLTKTLAADHSQDGKLEIKVYHKVQPNPGTQLNDETVKSKKVDGDLFVGLLRGDANSDGVVNDLDMEDYMAFLAGTTSSTPIKCPDALDLDKNGLIAWRSGTDITFNDCGGNKTTLDKDLKHLRKVIEKAEEHPGKQKRRAPALNSNPSGSCAYTRPTGYNTYTNAPKDCFHGPLSATPWTDLDHGNHDDD